MKQDIIESKNQEEVFYYLGIDMGLKKVGLALADSETKIAKAFSVLRIEDKNNIKDNNNQFFQGLKEIIEENQVKKVIIGKTGVKSQVFKNKKLENKITNLVKWLQEEFKLKVFFQEEMFTSRLAQNNLKADNWLKRAKKQGKSEDAEAARIILQEWIDKDLKV